MTEPPKGQSCATCDAWLERPGGKDGECRAEIPMYRRGESGRMELAVPVCPPDYWCRQWRKA